MPFVRFTRRRHSSIWSSSVISVGRVSVQHRHSLPTIVTVGPRNFASSRSLTVLQGHHRPPSFSFSLHRPPHSCRAPSMCSAFSVTVRLCHYPPFYPPIYLRVHRRPDVFVSRIINVVLHLHDHRPAWNAHLMPSSDCYVISHRFLRLHCLPSW